VRRRPRSGNSTCAECAASGFGGNRRSHRFGDKVSYAQSNAPILALEHLRRRGQSGFLNFGSGHGYSVMDVIECARQVTGRPIPTRIEGPGDWPPLVADPGKAEQVLGSNSGDVGLGFDSALALAVDPKASTRLRRIGKSPGATTGALRSSENRCLDPTPFTSAFRCACLCRCYAKPGSGSG